MEFFDLNGKVDLVTGGIGGIGISYAKGLGKAGAKLLSGDEIFPRMNLV